MTSFLMSLYFSVELTKEFFADIVKLYNESQLATKAVRITNTILPELKRINIITIYKIVRESDNTRSVLNGGHVKKVRQERVIS